MDSLAFHDAEDRSTTVSRMAMSMFDVWLGDKGVFEGGGG